jgi:LPPG:FO 2-phospho-L-lactate transferase
MIPRGRIVVLCGGVGGAKFALGLSKLLKGDELSIVVNTGDDFEHLGLWISPDLDTVTYTLAGVANSTTGWGRDGESWECMRALEALGADTWFRLGDKDLALHLMRSGLLRAGHSLTAATSTMAAQLHVSASILPMTNARMQTLIETTLGTLSFQEYFVREKCRPAIKSISFSGVELAKPTEQVLSALRDPALTVILLAPSNPFLSLDPIISVPGIRQVLRSTAVPVIAVSPVANGVAFKGPTVKIMQELGFRPNAREIAARYRDFLDGFVVDRSDCGLASEISDLGLAVQCTSISMPDVDSKVALARRTLEFARSCGQQAVH